MSEINWKRLDEPFPPHAIHWRIGSASKAKPSATLLAYLDARNVMERLDEVFGKAGWKDEYSQGPDGGVKCKLSAFVGDQWVQKEDGASNTAVEAIKGGYSGALKRAAVKWGIGRYLYALDSSWHPIKEGWPPDGVKTVSAKLPSGKWGYIVTPELPSWAVPNSKRDKPELYKEEPSVPFDGGGEEPPAEDPEEVRKAKHHPSWEEDRPRFQARLSVELDLNYNEVAMWMEAKGNPRPSGMTTKQRSRLLDTLQTEAGRGKFLDWKEER
jgi:hypothetical protein